MIVTAARKIIGTEGHEALTLRRLATDLGVTPPALYAHVESKDALLRAVAHCEFEWSIGVEWARGIANIADPVERLRELCRRYVYYARDNRQLFRLLLLFPPEFFRRENFDTTERPTSLGGRAFRPAAEAVRDAILEGRFGVHDFFLVALTLFTTVHGIAVFLLMEPDLGPDFEGQFVDTMIDAVLRGLATPEGPSGTPVASYLTNDKLV